MSKIDDARQFLRDALRNGPVLANKLFELAKEKGITEKTLKRAKKENLVSNGMCWFTTIGPVEGHIGPVEGHIGPVEGHIDNSSIDNQYLEEDIDIIEQNNSSINNQYLQGTGEQSANELLEAQILGTEINDELTKKMSALQSMLKPSLSHRRMVTAFIRSGISPDKAKELATAEMSKEQNDTV